MDLWLVALCLDQQTLVWSCLSHMLQGQGWNYGSAACTAKADTKAKVVAMCSNALTANEADSGSSSQIGQGSSALLLPCVPIEYPSCS